MRRSTVRRRLASPAFVRGKRTCSTRQRRSIRSLSLPLAVMAASALVSFFAVNGMAAPARVLASCYPYAWQPIVFGNHQSYGSSAASCDSGAPSYYYTVKLINRAGNDLAVSSGGPVSGTSFPETATVSCAGAYVRSFLYINVGGQGKSDTSGEADCAY